jgi:butyrate kinase
VADINLLVINPGSTSTKISIFENGKEIERKNLTHSAEEVGKYPIATDQSAFRQAEVEKFLAETGYDTSKLTAIACRGGSLPPCHMGAYVVNDEMIDVLCHRPSGQHASSCAAVIGYNIAKKLGIKAYIYDGNCADEMDPKARISGHPLVEKWSMGHFLNTKAVGRKYAEKIGKKYEDLNLIIVHTGGGISIGLHKKGVIVDVASDEDGAMSPERSGGLPSVGWARVCASGKYTEEELCAMVRGKGGLTAYLGTNDVREVEKRINDGDDYAKLIYDAMVYKVAKWVGAMAAAAAEKIDAIIITGGIAHSQMFTSNVIKHVEFIAPVDIILGEFEMEALAAGITRVLKGEEIAREYREDEKIR